MPIYEYKARDQTKSCDRCAKPFEVRQDIREGAVRRCPKCGRPVQRLISRCAVSRMRSTKSLLSDKNIKRHGFQRLVNEGDGRFRKT